MKVTRLTATGVHGYFPLDITFRPDFTFIVGLNGTGKTTALRILMACLTPNLEEFASLRFETAEITVQDGAKELVITAKRSGSGLWLSISTVDDSVHVPASELQMLAEGHRGTDGGNAVRLKYKSNPVIVAISELSTPMFLGLDRRYAWDKSREADAREYRMLEYRRRAMGEDDRGVIGVGLADVVVLVDSTLREIRQAVSKLDDQLRNKMLAGVFNFKRVDFSLQQPTPSRTELDAYLRRQEHLEEAAAGLKISVPDFTASLTDFFEQMKRVVSDLEGSAGEYRTTSPPTDPQAVAALLEWVMNKPQADRILEHIRMLDKYGADRQQQLSPITKFLDLVNGFLKQTKKSIDFQSDDELCVRLDGESQFRPMHALSSGERQILVMLAHLVLNKSLASSGVFVIDEPELSLHISWQERFVDAVREANPKVQLILATHSPAIILDRDDHCASLDR